MATEAVYTCSTCGAKWDRRRKSCAKCGGTGRNISVTLSERLDLKAGFQIEHKHAHDEKNTIFYNVNFLLTFGSPLLGFIVAGGPGVIVGFIIAALCWWLGPKAVQRIVEVHTIAASSSHLNKAKLH